MSTPRRTTRATSRQASSRGASPAPSDVTATPKTTSRRAGNATLPPVKLRASTAYGTNTVPVTASRAGPHTNQHISDVLGQILQPVREEGSEGATTPEHPRKTPSRTGRRKTRKASASSMGIDLNRTFGDESNVYGNADFDTSEISQLSDHGRINEDEDEDGYDEDDEVEDTLVLPPRDKPRFDPQAFQPAFRRNPTSSRPFQQPANPAANVASPQQWYGSANVRQNIGQFIPSWVAHPLEALDSDVASTIQRDVRGLNTRFSWLRQQKELDTEAIRKLEQRLPDFLVIKKDKIGNAKIPTDFWHALRDLIRSDVNLIPPPAAKSGSVAIKEFERKAGAIWDKYVHQNRARLASMSLEEFELKFPEFFKKNLVASKTEIVEMVRHSWDENRDIIKPELKTISSDLEEVKAKITSLQKRAAGLSHDKVKSIVNSHIKSIIPVNQLEAIAKAMMKNQVNYGLTRINHWSPGTGAVIHPTFTSPIFAFPSMKQNFFTKFFGRVLGNPLPWPNSPTSALTRWEEHGDCWCSPTSGKGLYEHGPTLGVISGSKVSPDQVIIEHIAPTASFEPGATPKDMELLAYIDDFAARGKAVELSARLFSQHDHEHDTLIDEYGYVRIAAWTFDGQGDPIQAFEVPVSLNQYKNGHTDKLVVRARNNHSRGKVDYTCMYRVRIHGEFVEERSTH
ncbi:putative spindle pole body-associated protein sad1 [Amylocarpus encephaloides]|uniref:Spindle pole body-associated protein sad1 n=1 Tax=Amylocarpus encephaloides TaxID=45428 RepID=A0A9P7YLF5_9HELO|nr:putative spindle pole body-associated protein sad1 [Amylocarpus encephaloides]